MILTLASECWGTNHGLYALEDELDVAPSKIVRGTGMPRAAYEVAQLHNTLTVRRPSSAKSEDTKLLKNT